MRVRFKRGECPVWNRIIDSTPDDLITEEFVEKLGGKLFSDDPMTFTYEGIEFATEADYTWFMMRI